MRCQRYCRDLLYRGQAEQSYTATHIAPRVAVKLRLDLFVTSPAGCQLTLIDFKTTSAPDSAHFIATIEKYNSDRQAALYLDVLGATRFLIIGAQKKENPFGVREVWRVELTATPGLIEQRRKKYAALLRYHAGQAAGLSSCRYACALGTGRLTCCYSFNSISFPLRQASKSSKAAASMVSATWPPTAKSSAAARSTPPPRPATLTFKLCCAKPLRLALRT